MFSIRSHTYTEKLIERLEYDEQLVSSDSNKNSYTKSTRHLGGTKRMDKRVKTQISSDFFVIHTLLGKNRSPELARTQIDFNHTRSKDPESRFASSLVKF